MALDLDPDRVRQAAAAGQSVVFGDAAPAGADGRRPGARQRGGGELPDTPSALKILATSCGRTRPGAGDRAHHRRREMESLRGAGATEVVPEAIEGSLMLASHALALVGVPMRRVIRVVQDQRDARYGLLRGLLPRRRRRHRRRPADRRACSA